MQVHYAVMLDENEVADHNCPTVLHAVSEEALLVKVKDFIKAHSAWDESFENCEYDFSELGLDDINDYLSEYEDQTLFVHTGVDEL